MKKSLLKLFITIFAISFFCNNVSAQITGDTAICKDSYGYYPNNYTCSNSAASYSWSISPAGPSVTTYGPLQQNAVFYFTTSGHYTVTVNTTSPISSYTLAVFAKPSPTFTITSTSTICSGDTVDLVNFVTSPPGLTVNWQWINGPYSYTAVGLPYSGTGDINNYVAPVYSGGSLRIVEFRAHTFLNGCQDTDSLKFQVKVVPIVSINPISNQTVCAGIPSSVISIPTNSTSLLANWTCSLPTIGCAASGVGNIPSFTPGGTDTISTITATVGPYGCSPDTAVFTIEVNPSIFINSITNQTVCSNDTISSINFITSPPGFPVTWTNDNTTIGLPANGSGNIGEYTSPSINGGSLQTGNIIASATLNGCTSTNNFQINVVPHVSINPITSQTVCPGSNTASISISTNSSAYTANWTNSNTGIGLAASGSGNIPSFTTSSTPATSTITAICNPNGCPGDTSVFTLSTIFNTIPITASNDTICLGSNIILTVPQLSQTHDSSLFSNTTDYAIPDNNFAGISSTINVNGLSGNVSSAQLMVKLNITHTAAGNLDIYLRSPSGNTIILSSLNGSSGDNYINTVFSDAGLISINSVAAPFTGTYMPEDPFSNLSASSLNGAWKLLVLDVSPGSIGTLLDWTLTVITPHNYTWSPSFNLSSSIGDTVTAFPSSSTSYTVSLPMVGGCIATGTVNIDVGGAPKSISGTAYSNSTPVTAGQVYLFSPSQTGTSYDTIGFTNLNASGQYLFSSITNGDYLIKCIPDSILYPQLINTYYGDLAQWDSASIINHSCDIDFIADINLIQSSLFTGSGSVSGTVVEGTGFGSKLVNNNSVQNIGSPIKNVDVNLIKLPSGQVVSQSTTNANGFYEFTNIANGDYTIQVDIPGLVMDASYSFTINPVMEYSFLSFAADDNSIYPTNTIGINELKNRAQEISIFPNPAKNAVTIRANGFDTKGYDVEVLNAQGLSVFKGENNLASDYTLDLKKLNIASGLYVIKLSSGNVIKTAKLIVE